MSSTCSRRAFLEGLGIAGGALALYACTGSSGSSLPSASATMCGANLCIDLADPGNSALTAVDGALLVDAPNDTIIVIRSSETAIIALSGICTHAGCSMDFVPASHLIDCPCHGSQFSEDGRVVRGPARRSLRVYTASLATNVITITLA
ncbi:MAG TPA: Rieske (2Fe-2S) protein [Kofleriaceae bacterium]|nr:Rieske (2Fe-2S) protein [Kofleriaceae bacterium]